MPRKGRKKKDILKAAAEEQHVSNAEKDVPKSMVFRRGQVGAGVRALEKDLRVVLAPYTAAKLQENRKNTLKVNT